MKQSHGQCSDLSEGTLIAIRMGLFHVTPSGLQNLFVCNKHRDYYGLRFRPKNYCHHPIHKDKVNQKCDRTVGADMSREISQAWDIVVPIGSGMYYCYCILHIRENHDNALKP